MEAAKIFIFTEESFQVDLEASLDRLVEHAATLGLKAEDVKGNIVCTLTLIINFASNPAMAKKETNNLADSAGRSGTDAMVLVGVSTLVQMYGEGDFEAALSNNLEVIKAAKARFEKKAASTPVTPKKGEGNQSGSPHSDGTPKTPTPKKNEKPYFAEGSSFGNAVIGGPPPYSIP